MIARCLLRCDRDDEVVEADCTTASTGLTTTSADCIPFLVENELEELDHGVDDGIDSPWEGIVYERQPRGSALSLLHVVLDIPKIDKSSGHMIIRLAESISSMDEDHVRRVQAALECPVLALNGADESVLLVRVLTVHCAVDIEPEVLALV